MASISHWGMFPVTFGPAELEYRWDQGIGGFVIGWMPPSFMSYTVTGEVITWVQP